MCVDFVYSSIKCHIDIKFNVMDTSIFKTYDIRGVYGENINESTARDVARACGTLFPRGVVIVGHDARKSSSTLFRALSLELSKNPKFIVISVGMSTTPMFYFSVNEYSAVGGVMVTASHNPKEWNGFKVVGKGARMIGGKEIGNIIIKKNKKTDFSKKKDGPIRKIKQDNKIADRYAMFLKKRTDVKKQISVVFDCGNGVAGIVLKKIFPFKNIKAHTIFEKPDGNFPGRNPNPLTKGALLPLSREVKNKKADIGIAFDADADRMFLVDEKGRVVPSYIVMIILSIFSKGPFVSEVLMYHMLKSVGFRKNIFKTKVGTYFVKEKMRKERATIAGEYSGHYYFRDFFFTDSGILAALKIISAISSLPYSVGNFVQLSPQLFIESFNIYSKNHKKSIASVEKILKSRIVDVDETDGKTFILKDGWINVRSSNTEPLLRFFVAMHSKNKKISLTRILKSRTL